MRESSGIGGIIVGLCVECDFAYTGNIDCGRRAIRPASDLLKKAAGVAKGASNPLTDKVGSVTKAQVKEIAETKMADLSARDIDAAMKIIEGSARSMGITVND